MKSGRIGFVATGLAMVTATTTLLAPGCVAVNVGKPDVFTHAETRRETAAAPSRTELAAARGQLEQRGNVAMVGIAAEWRDEHPKTRWEETVTVRRQRRLAFGLFPAAAEQYLMPRGALKSGMGLSRMWHRNTPEFCAYYGETDWDYAGTQIVTLLMGCGFCQLVGTLNALLVQPFAGWPCQHDMVDGGCLKRGVKVNGHGPYADASQSPKIRALAKFPRSERRKMGFQTCWDDELGGDGAAVAEGTTGFWITHMGLVGFHKHLAVFVEPVREGPHQDDGAEMRMRHMDVRGPYLAELSIPALGFKRVKRVAPGSRQADFELPPAARECITDALLSFRPDHAGGASGVETRQALARVAGQSYRFDVTLQPGTTSAQTPAEASPPPRRTPAAGAPPQPPVQGKMEEGRLWEITGIRRSEAGRYEVRVAIADRSKTFEIGWMVEGDVRRIIREDFASRHPGTDIQYVHEVVEWKTEEEGTVLVYRGWGFSARSARDGWKYDEKSHRGSVRLQISDGMLPEAAKRWARENIEAIVREKNVLLNAGALPPEGAMYRSLGETLENGVLTVEFEAVE